VPPAGDAPRSGAPRGTRTGEVFSLADEHAAHAIAEVITEARWACSRTRFLFHLDHISNDQHGFVCENAVRFAHETQFRDRN
jgi:hypothetical protein